MIGAIIIFAVAGISWRLGGEVWWMGPLCSLTLPLLLPKFSLSPGNSKPEDARHRFVAAFVYFAAGSWGLVPGSGVFFGHGPTSYLLGATLWLLSSALLALPWVLAKSGIGALVAMLLDALPPLGLFGWLSPFAAAGVLFPGLGVLGFGGLAALIVAVSPGHDLIDEDNIRPGRVLKPLFAAVLAVLGANLFHVCQQSIDSYAAPPTKFAGVNTALGLMPHNQIAVIKRNQRLIAGLRAASRYATVVLTPETVATWLPGTAAQFEAAVPPGRTWLIGATTLDDYGAWSRSDAIVEIRRGQPARILFRSALPVPISMWHPWQPAGSYSARWWEPARTIAGKRVWAAICYDQLLFWPWINAIEERPGVVLAVSNEWWARGTGIPVIQRSTTRAYARLIGARVIWAENR